MTDLPEIRPTNEMSAEERHRLVESMKPEDAETVPELHEVDVPDELREAIESAMSRYPQIRSAALPALWAVQRTYGWCSPEGIRQAAAVMGVTPGYLESLATFYDLFRTTPVGRHQVLVCHNISCWLRGADALLDAFCEAAGADAHEADHGGVSSADGEVFVRSFECLGACDLAPMASIDERYYGPLDAGDAQGAVEQLRSGAEVLPHKALAGRPAAGGPEPGADPETRMLFKRIDEPRLASIEAYRDLGGYRSLERAIREPEELLGVLEEAGLRGRGGAGFSMGKKASFLPRGERSKYLCCNADESEPGAFKDRELMQKNPHQLIEGIAIAALAAGAGWGFVFIRGEYAAIADILERAVAEAYEAGFLGEDILGSGHRVEVVVHRGAGAYICGEETALLDALEGKRGNPRLKPPFPAIQGLYGGPTLINNVETLSNVPHIVANGAEWFKGFGTEQSPGTKVVSVSGCVKRPGNYEVELGISTRELIYTLAGGPPDGRQVKAWFPGGSSAPVLTAAELDLPYSFEAMADAGSMLGSGSIIVADDSTSIPELALRTARFYHHESCGKCTPCREGTNWTVKMLERVISGEATPMDLDIVASVQENIIGHCLCVLGDSMAMPVGSMVAKFRSEFEETIARAQARDEVGVQAA
ncbi:MAG TPA: NADH-quinone oxidoreductase subunit NuoF [Solirubrobacterales bacterium]|nr:NADH-quinone oxidoreductase subunit NuoF [Solirubrobacterales bacterium]